MRIFTTSDLHVDYRQNAQWVAELSRADFKDDLLILAGDISDSLERIERTIGSMAERFKQVLYVPGNHDLWVLRSKDVANSFDKFQKVRTVVENSGASLDTFHGRTTTIVPLLGWYDYSFGEPSPELRRRWMDYRACRWPDGTFERDVTEHFTGLNEPISPPSKPVVISFSHFMPRIDLMPSFAPERARFLFPILGTHLLEGQIRRVGSSIHIYGHSHINRRAVRDGVIYINNAYGYPSEDRFTAKKLLCVHEDTG
ncbi:MAG: metallophosphoesterase [Hyphomicrobiales bacterium]|nr:metallophosphoesterase [Hyphomicrobiales bacterium]MCP5000153.1 metallophosphoesterase [Hyphomicrobiales bacterium]